jgi:NO-binding membrane sensor protein with MHYT domain
MRKWQSASELISLQIDVKTTVNSICKMGELHAVFHPEFLALSFGISFAGAYCGINICEQFRLSTREKSKLLGRELLMLMMAISIGGVAIWSMHFVGMSTISFKDPNGQDIKVRYRKDLTLVSLFVSILFCFTGIFICSKDAAFKIERMDTMEEFIKEASLMSISEIKRMRSANFIMFLALFKSIHLLALGGLVTAIGVCVMHYLGMAAIVTEAKLEYDFGIVAASLVIAITAATAGYWILFRLLALYPHVELLRFISSIVIAVAVNGMHYTGMAAAKFKFYDDGASLLPVSQTLGSEQAVIGSIIASMIFLLAMLLITIADIRAWFYMNGQTVRACDDIMRSLQACEYPNSATREALNKYYAIRGEKIDFFSRPVLHGRPGPAIVVKPQAELCIEKSKRLANLNEKAHIHLGDEVPVLERRASEQSIHVNELPSTPGEAFV